MANQENSTKSAILLRDLVSKMYNLKRSEKELLDDSKIGFFRKNIDSSLRGYTPFGPFSGQSYSKKMPIMLSKKPLTSYLVGFHPKPLKNTYESPEEVFLHELGHVRALKKGHGFRDYTSLVYPEKLEMLGEDVAERFAEGITDRSEPTLKELVKLQRSPKFSRFFRRFNG